MQTVKLSQLVLALSPELYDLLTETERNANVMIHGKLSDINRDDMNRIVAQTIAYHHESAIYH
ncbi:MAG: hypothetical protein WB502_13390 [Thermoactinomyces sp.]